MEKQAVEYIIKKIVDSPSEVVVREDFDGRDLHFKFKALDSDIGKVIGKNGKVIKAINLYLSSLGRKNRRTIDLELERNER